MRKLEQGSLTEAIKYQQLHGGARKHSSLMGVQPGLLSSETRGGERVILGLPGPVSQTQSEVKVPLLTEVETSVGENSK